MKKILIFGAIVGLLLDAPAMSAVRDGVAVGTRAKATSQSGEVTQARTSTTILRSNNTDSNVRSSNLRGVAPRTSDTRTTRAGALKIGNLTTRTTNTRPVIQVGRTATNATRNGSNRGAIMARVAESNTAKTMAETRTGAAYTRCKDAYFQCMDQFCQLKNDEYRRCSCSDRIRNLSSVRNNITETNNKLTEFAENLDMVGLTAAQATAMHTASDGENALATDTSASKALLNAIMKSIRGQDSTVSGKLSDLNSINLSFDTSNAFGITDTAQIIASYNGTELYNAVYPSCRNAVTSDCNDASLQRAVTAYLMAIEQDCNTVQTALENKQKELKGAIREGSAMLDLARIENRKKHNSDNLATCINNIENAILSEQVCGANYHKCLDNGEFIDVSTGAPISGVVNFYELGNLLKFDAGRDAMNQKLSQNSNNQKFLKSFEAKTKQFAKDALDKCTEIADTAWSEYLDRALLSIYYAQQSKVETIKNGCFDLISACYEDKDAGITAAMASLIDGTSEISLMPDKIVLTKQMCSDYINSCNNMFANEEENQNIIADYIAKQTNKDTLDACRAIVQQCFSNFGGTNYENFYYPSSGLFTTNGFVDAAVYDSNTGDAIPKTKPTALDWFTLYKYDVNGNRELDENTHDPIYVSECAKQVASVSSCADLVEQAFGGLDLVVAQQRLSTTYGMYEYLAPGTAIPSGTPVPNEFAYAYGWAKSDDLSASSNIWDAPDYKFQNRRLRPTGVATEIYNNIIDTLSTQCMNVQGKFIEPQFIDHNFYRYPDKICIVNWQDVAMFYSPLISQNYGTLGGTGDEYLCPRDYMLTVDTTAWGACSCWENGGRRSKHGLSSKCSAIIPVQQEAQDAICDNSMQLNTTNQDPTFDTWCTSQIKLETNQVCPFNDQSPTCDIPTDPVTDESLIPTGI
ncbi:MAG: hypothetical protein J5742_04145 [Alphaproteobacteria bacterium]|nr:hypothetical protein [Alphaproteobacteria bacterium]